MRKFKVGDRVRVVTGETSPPSAIRLNGQTGIVADANWGTWCVVKMASGENYAVPFEDLQPST